MTDTIRGYKSIIVASFAALVLAYLLQPKWPNFEELNGKNVLLCGGSTGIGRSMALLYAKHGANVIIVSRTMPKLQAVIDESNRLSLNGTITAITADLSSNDNARDLVKAALTKFNNRLDMLVLNHISPFFELVHASAATDLERILNVNLASYVFLTKHALASIEQSQGKIVAVSSVAGKVGIPYCAAYSAAKHGLHGFFDALRVELDMVHPNHTMTVTTAVIGSVDTESVKRISKGVLDDYRRESPDNVALAIVGGALTGKREVYYPLWETVPITYIRFIAPSLADWLVQANMRYRAAPSKA
eukprot:TRINITY_DN5353_c0_g1_i2.p1 TRINITY_DN5353_c0_g1~~TRINITY_DN5353_c0_g1_i2.p1  ORF type:complete len:303 (+),score=48.30 TRINITY_DN5353_c0_g1_i2:123-1031(+)